MALSIFCPWTSLAIFTPTIQRATCSAVTGKPRIDEREILLGSGTDLKQIGKVKNNFGGFDYIMKNLK